MRCWVMDDYLQTARCCTNSSSPASSHTNLIAFPAACCDQEGSAILSLSYDFCCSPSTRNIITNHYSNLHPNTLIWLAQTILCEIWIKLFIKLYSNVIDSKFSASCLVRCDNSPVLIDTAVHVLFHSNRYTDCPPFSNGKIDKEELSSVPLQSVSRVFWLPAAK